jgi:ABC-2 type transport system permease protein
MLMRDTWVVFTRALRLSARQPVWVIFGLIQPALYLVLFGPLLQAVAKGPGFGSGDAWTVFVPGLLVQLGLLGASFVGFGLIAEWRSGVIGRMRVTPASRAALLLGRVLRDVLVLLVQATVLTGMALLFGLRAPWWAMGLGIAMVALLGACFSALSYAVALKLKSEDAFAPLLNGVSLPLLLLSGVLLPMTLGPLWLQRLSLANPLRYVLDGLRAVYRGELTSLDSVRGIVVTVALVCFGLVVGTRVFQNENA